MLSEEEKKAIEWLKNKPDECTNIINSSSYIGNKKAYAKERANFKTVFNIITKLQKENEELKNKNKHLKLENDAYGNTIVKQDVEIKEKDRYIKNSEEITTEMNNDIKKLLLEIKKKDKQIDLMSEYIYNTQMECNIYYKDKEEVKNKFAKM